MLLELYAIIRCVGCVYVFCLDHITSVIQSTQVCVSECASEGLILLVPQMSTLRMTCNTIAMKKECLLLYSKQNTSIYLSVYRASILLMSDSALHDSSACGQIPRPTQSNTAACTLPPDLLSSMFGCMCLSHVWPEIEVYACPLNRCNSDGDCFFLTECSLLLQSTSSSYQ